MPESNGGRVFFWGQNIFNSGSLPAAGSAARPAQIVLNLVSSEFEKKCPVYRGLTTSSRCDLLSIYDVALLFNNLYSDCS